MNQSLRILFVEDHADLAANLCDYFEEKGHITDTAMDGVTGLHLALVNDYDVIVLDLMLPGMSGLVLCQKLRQEGKKNTPVLMLTARHTLEDKEAGFNSGTDDYLVKPFELKELEWRIQALAKRAAGLTTRTIMKVSDLEYDSDSQQLRRGGRRLELPTIPMRILDLLMRRTPNVVLRHEIEQAVWGDFPPDSDALRVHIHTLRMAINFPGTPTLLHTVRGVGYRLADDHASLV